MNSQNAEIFSAVLEEDRLSKDLVIAKFNKAAKEYFQQNAAGISDQKEFLDEISQQVKYNLPDDLNEIFIERKFAPLLWISNTPLVNKIYNISLSPSNAAADKLKFSEIRSFYSKWAMQKNENDRHYFAFSALNLLDKLNNPENIIKNFLIGTLYSFDKELHSPEDALKNFVEINSKLESVKVEDYLIKDIKYLAELFSGFALWETGEFELVKQKFSAAQSLKNSGMSAAFYEALSDCILGNRQLSMDKITSLLNYDDKRLKFAVSKNSLGLYSFFLRNSFITKVFRETQFASYLKDLSYLLKTTLSSESDSFTSIQQKLNILKEHPLYEFVNKEAAANFRFITDYLNLFGTNKNIFVVNSASALQKKICHVKDLILQEITDRNMDQIKEKLSIYTKAIDENKELIEYWKVELDDKVKKLKNVLEQNIKKIDENFSNHILRLEDSIERLESKKEFDPGSTFNNSMVYNFIISLLIFTVGGFASVFSNDSIYYESGSILGKIMTEGLKWGGITFLLGILVAFLSSISAIWEKSSEKKRILQSISFMKNQKERDISAVKKDFETKSKKIEENYQKEIDKYKQENEDITQEMQLQSEEIKASMESDLETKKNALEKILEC